MRRPFVTVKVAQTLDGKIAAEDSSSRWISCKESINFVHRLRADNDAVLVGVGTVLKDNPLLTVRYVKGKNPVRVVLDARLRTPLKSNIVKNKDARSIIFTKKSSSQIKKKKLMHNGIEIETVPHSGDMLNIKYILNTLYKRGIRNVLIEGGTGIISSFVKNRLVDRFVIIISPKILGKGSSAFEKLDIWNINGAIKLTALRAFFKGEDLIYIAEFR